MIEYKECRYGPMLYLQNDQWVGKSFDFYGEAFENQINFMSRFVGQDDVVLDGGANMGAMTIPLAKRCSRVIAFEPQEFLYYILCGNIAANNLTNVRAYMNPLDAVSGRVVAFPRPSDDYFGEGHFAGVAGTSINLDGKNCLGTKCIDQLFLDRLDFVKMDVEGAELMALFGGRDTLEQFKPVMFVEALPNNFEDIQLALRRHNYVGYLVSTDYFNPNNFLGKSRDVLQNKSHDVVCWHREEVEKWESVFQEAIKECHGVDSLHHIGD